MFSVQMQSQAITAVLVRALDFAKTTSQPVSDLTFSAKQMQDMRVKQLASRALVSDETQRTKTPPKTGAQVLALKAQFYFREIILKPLEALLIQPIALLTSKLTLTDNKIKSLLRDQERQRRFEQRDELVKGVVKAIEKITIKDQITLSKTDLAILGAIDDIVKDFDRNSPKLNSNAQTVAQAVQSSIFRNQHQRLIHGEFKGERTAKSSKSDSESKTAKSTATDKSGGVIAPPTPRATTEKPRGTKGRGS